MQSGFRNKTKYLSSGLFHKYQQKTIIHVYDDRGCDLLATSPETIRNMYETYNDWILDYDKPEIDKVFN